MKPDILGTEKWIVSSVSDSEYLPDRYNYEVVGETEAEEEGEH